jgi:hypothetical protein
MMRMALFAAVLITALGAGPASAEVTSPTVTLAVGPDAHTASGGALPPRHVFTPFSVISLSATVTTPDGSVGTIGDLYIGATLPDGRFASWVGAGTPTLVVGPDPVPLGRRMAFDGARTVTVSHTFDGSEPGGGYLLFAILVRPGKSALDQNQWIDGAVATVLFDPLAPCFTGLIDCAFPPIADLADAIVVFVPDADFPGITGANELPIPGRVLSVERGSVAPGTPIILTPNTFGSPMRGGVPRRLGLARFRDRPAFYPIFVGEEIVMGVDAGP